MWDEAARAPAAVDPAFIRMTGFFAVASRATRRNRRPSSILSTYPRITRVSGSSERNSIISSSDKSALFPRLTTLENPIPAPTAQSRTPVRRAPDCEKKAITPGGGDPTAKEAFSLAWVSITPRQFGPTARTDVLARTSRRACSNDAPSPPISLNPAEITIAAFIPFSAKRGIASIMAGGGMTNTPRSTTPGIAPMSLWKDLPRTSPPAGFTPYTSPGNPEATRLVNTLKPTFPGFREAPSTATEFG